MLLSKSFPYTISIKNHAFIGIALGILVLFIILFFEPFNSGNSNIQFKTIYFSVYGLITSITYLILHLFSVMHYSKIKSWKLSQEIIFCLTFITISTILAFYYTEIVINNKPERLNLVHFIGWFKAIFLGFGIIILIPTILLRKQFAKSDLKIKKENSVDIVASKKINLSGSLKKEFLQVDET